MVKVKEGVMKLFIVIKDLAKKIQSFALAFVLLSF